MNRKEWQAIDRATLGEIKRAYHRKCKQHHPDIAGNGDGKDAEIIYRLTEAYELLMRYCREYRFPLTAGDSDIYDAEDWWMDRFGQDPLWSRKKT